ncbi:hypothetical protein ACQ856_20035 [Mycolicibacterium psychrotolerans]|uniref:hypothetical protein n=1 Tax=Mycolicibacterium psychrotolerans TaxID=216929 RepID=UPI003D6677FA
MPLQRVGPDATDVVDLGEVGTDEALGQDRLELQALFDADARGQRVQGVRLTALRLATNSAWVMTT